MGSWSNTLAVKSANYTVVSGDDGDTFILNASSYFQITYGAAGGYNTNHVNKLINPISSPRGVGVVVNGLSTFTLYPGQSCWIENTGGGGWFASDPGAWLPASSPTFYVDPAAGSDTNSDGLASAGGATAFKTATQASTVAYAMNTSIRSATIQLLGNNVEALNIAGSLPGQGFVLNYNGGTLTAPIAWSLPGAADAQIISIEDFACVAFNGFLFGMTGSAVGSSIALRQLCVCDIANCQFGSNLSGVAMKVQDGARINLVGGIEISGSMAAVFQTLYHGGIECGGENIEFSGSPNIGILFDIIGPGMIDASGMTFSGSASSVGGQQYSVSDNGVLFTDGMTFPSSLTAGTTSNGGIIA